MTTTILRTLIITASLATLINFPLAAEAAEVGRELPDLTLKDGNGEVSTIPDFGEKVLTFVYADMQGADMNDPVADALKASGIDADKVTGIGLANLKDTWVPNAVSRMVIRRKAEKYDTIILTDEDGTVASRWELGDCNDESVFIVLGKDRLVKYVKKGAVRGAEIEEVVDLVRAETAR